ncbi:MAG: hypothetical protein KF809_17475 [Chloroflexi bacterium]|nr:hypothetical protein [Chloroflexota bacterium]
MSLTLWMALCLSGSLWMSHLVHGDGWTWQPTPTEMAIGCIWMVVAVVHDLCAAIRGRDR